MNHIEAMKQALELLMVATFNSPELQAKRTKVINAGLAAIEQAEKQEPVAVHQYRVPHCSDWYDGIPDHHDGHGPYEVRTLYTTPPGGRQSEDCLTAAPVQEPEGMVMVSEDFLLNIKQRVNTLATLSLKRERYEVAIGIKQDIADKLREKNGGQA
jgi:hypothetical protein